MKKPEILFLITSLQSGGIENYLLRFLQFYGVEGCTCFCALNIGGALEEKYRRLGVNLVFQRFSYVNPFTWIPFMTYLQRHKPDIICDFRGDFAAVALTIARLCGVRYRICWYRHSSHLFTPHWWNLAYSFVCNRLIRWNGCRILSNSEAALDFYHPYWRKRPGRFRVIRNGISKDWVWKGTREESRDALHLPQEAFVIGHTGNFRPPKNHKTILAVAIELCRRHSRIHFVLCGKNVPENCASAVEQAGLTGQIHLFSHIPDVNRMLKALDIFYFPSVTEGQPNALIEAMVSNIPVCSSNIAAIGECVPAEIRPDLLPPQDVDAAVKYLEECCLHPEKMDRLRCGEWAARAYDAEKCFLQFQEELFLPEEASSKIC
ncbi:MAG: glycosyltransferase [Lentisphaeria bacterium]|nr:glycosyltransferase [Lentisphaeria bacterium]